MLMNLSAQPMNSLNMAGVRRAISIINGFMGQMTPRRAAQSDLFILIVGGHSLSIEADETRFQTFIVILFHR